MPRKPHQGGTRGSHLNSEFQREAVSRRHQNPYEMGKDAKAAHPELAAFLEAMPLKELPETKKIARVLKAAFRNYKKEVRAQQQAVEQWLEEQRQQQEAL